MKSFQTIIQADKTVFQSILQLQQPYGYTGREYDAESGLYYYRARTYGPNIGMFLQADPIGYVGGDFNIYAYVSNDPFGWGDPSGLTGTQAMGRLSTGTAATSVSAMTYVGMGATSAAGSILNNLRLIGQSPLDIGQDKNGFKVNSPGFCRAAEHLKMQNLVNSLKGVRGCIVMPPSIRQSPVLRTRWDMVNLSKMRRFSKLALARHAINVTCFGNSHQGHINAKDSALSAMNKCYGIILYNNPKGIRRLP